MPSVTAPPTPDKTIAIDRDRLIEAMLDVFAERVADYVALRAAHARAHAALSAADPGTDRRGYERASGEYYRADGDLRRFEAGDPDVVRIAERLRLVTR